MSDARTDEEIDRCASHFYAIQADVHGPVWKSLWEELPEDQKEGWRRIARSVRGVVHHEEATSGGWPTSPQADKIRELRESYPPDIWEETHSLIGETRPYGEMVVIFKAKEKLPGAKVDVRPERAYLIHPDGHLEELHKERVPDSYMSGQIRG